MRCQPTSVPKPALTRCAYHLALIFDQIHTEQPIPTTDSPACQHKARLGRCAPLKLFKVEDPAPEGNCDYWNSFVVAETNTEEARLAGSLVGDNGTSPETWVVTYLGEAGSDVDVGVVCLDWYGD